MPRKHYQSTLGSPRSWCPKCKKLSAWEIMLAYVCPRCNTKLKQVRIKGG